jgi:hypothetical protein
MRRPFFTATPVAVFAVPAAVMILAAPFAHAQTAIEDSCKSSGGTYNASQVKAHVGEDENLFETCCTGTGPSQKCVTYKNGVESGN